MDSLDPYFIRTVLFTIFPLVVAEQHVSIYICTSRSLGDKMLAGRGQCQELIMSNCTVESNVIQSLTVTYWFHISILINLTLLDGGHYPPIRK